MEQPVSASIQVSGDGIIRLRHVVNRGSFRLDVDQMIPSRGITGLFGESGSGKTTLLSCISARLAPTNGVVEYDLRGRGLTDIYALSEPERRLLLRTADPLAPPPPEGSDGLLGRDGGAAQR